MVTINISKEEYETIQNYKVEHYFNDFAFDEFKMRVHISNGNKYIYEVKKVGSNYDVKFRLIAEGRTLDCVFVYTENEETTEFIEVPHGEYVTRVVDSFKRNKVFGKRLKKAVRNLYELILALDVGTLVKVKQYIMNESYKRSVVYKQALPRKKDNKEGKRKTNPHNTCSEQFLLNDIVEYVSHSGCKHNIACECWEVRGHFRHYKNGKVVWIKGYEKGSKRNTGALPKDKIYSL